MVWAWTEKEEWALTPCKPSVTEATGYSHGQEEQMRQTGFLNHLGTDCDFKQQVRPKQLQSCTIKIICSA